jgi:hypothetical protein
MADGLVYRPGECDPAALFLPSSIIPSQAVHRAMNTVQLERSPTPLVGFDFRSISDPVPHRVDKNPSRPIPFCTKAISLSLCVPLHMG